MKNIKLRNLNSALRLAQAGVDACNSLESLDLNTEQKRNIKHRRAYWDAKKEACENLLD